MAKKRFTYVGTPKGQRIHIADMRRKETLCGVAAARGKKLPALLGYGKEDAPPPHSVCEKCERRSKRMDAMVEMTKPVYVVAHSFR